jgi:hypothetical protein
LHVPGPDPDAGALADSLGKVKCREQIVWLTHSCSGWFVERFSRPERIVISATAKDFEFNETEFPYALATTVARPAAELDGDGDGRVSVLELFVAAAQEAEARFERDKRIPTEHAQLDDNGDGKGSEIEALINSAAEPASEDNVDTAPTNTPETRTPPERRDGTLAGSTYLPYPAFAATAPTPSEQNNERP